MLAGAVHPSIMQARELAAQMGGQDAPISGKGSS